MSPIVSPNEMEKVILEEIYKDSEKDKKGFTVREVIDKILYDWTKKGYKKASDVRKKKKVTEEVELFEFYWLDEND